MILTETGPIKKPAATADRAPGLVSSTSDAKAARPAKRTTEVIAQSYCVITDHELAVALDLARPKVLWPASVDSPSEKG